MVYTSDKPPKPLPNVPSLWHYYFKQNKNDIPKDRICYLDVEKPEMKYTYGQVEKEILKATAGLQREFGFQDGDVLAICAPNDVEYGILLHGAVMAGGATAAIDQAAPVDLIAHDLDVVQPKVIVTHADNIDRVVEAAITVNFPKQNILVFGDKKVQGHRTISETILSKEEYAEAREFTKEELDNKPAFLYFTSGTTGGKKAVIITQSIVLANLLLKEDYPSYEAHYLAYTEFHHVSSFLAAFHFCIYFGYSVYIMAHYSLTKFCEVVQKYKIHMTNTQPYVIAALAKEDMKKKYDLSSLKYMFTGGAALDKAVTLAAKERLGVKIQNIYGMTELLCLFHTDPEVTEKNGIGYLAPGFQVKIVDDDGEDVPQGEMGELLVKGPTVTKGYYRNPEATARAIDSEGYLHTGDMVACDENGMFTYVDRVKDLIKYLLIQIYPSEIETVLNTHPKVAECAVIGVYYSDQATELPRAYIKLINGEQKSEELEREILEYTNSRLTEEKHLRGGLFIVDEFPRTASGKIQRRVLKEKANKGEHI